MKSAISGDSQETLRAIVSDSLQFTLVYPAHAAVSEAIKKPAPEDLFSLLGK